MDNLTTATIEKSSPNQIARLIVGIVLLLPALLLYASIQLGPALEVLRMSQTDFDIMSEPQFVGMANYNHLVEDRVFLQSIGLTFKMVMARLLVVAVVPPLVGLLLGASGRVGRGINRVLLTLVGVLVSPVALAVLASAFVSRIWGRQPSIFQDVAILGSPETAPVAMILLDAIITLGMATAVGGAVYMAVMRGRREGKSVAMAAIGVWVLGLLFAVASTSQTFELPFIMTNGGPVNSTTTMAYFFYRNAFNMFQFGYAAAMAAIWIVDAVLAALLVWIVLVAFRLRLTTVPVENSYESSNGLGVLGMLLLLLTAVPFVGLAIWGLWQAGLTPAPDLNIARTMYNTVNGPWTAIWWIQIPVTYFCGMALGLVRPLGRIGSNIIFLFFLMMAFLPGEALTLSWFNQSRQLGILNTQGATGISSLVSAFSLIVFKLFFDGIYTKFNQARANGQSGIDAFVKIVFLPSIPIWVLVGSVLSFASAQAVLWPFIAVNGREGMGFPMTLAVLRATFSTSIAPVIGTTLIFMLSMGAVFLPIIALLQVLFLDRLALVSGPEDEVASVPDEPLFQDLGTT